MTGRRRLVALAVGLVVLLGACRLDVTADVRVAADGSGTIRVEAVLDRATSDRLTATGVSLLPQQMDGWDVSEDIGDDVHRITAQAPFASPQELGELVDDLNAGLDDQDPALVRDVVLTVDEDGTAELTGTAGLRVPSSAGADVAGWPDAARMQELAAANDVTATLTVHAPGSVEQADGGTDVQVDGATATWHLPVGQMVPVQLRANAPSLWDSGLPRLVAAGIIVVGVALFVPRLRARRRERRQAPLGRVQRMR